VHAPSEIRYKLGGKYSNFIAEVGVDDKVCDHGSVVFEVWADGEKLYNSGVMYGNTATKQVNVSVNGKQELKLKAGGKTEILGGLLYPIQTVPAEQPAFINDGSSLSVSIAESCYASDYNYKVIVKETRKRVTKTLPNTAIPKRTFCSFTLPLYVGAS